MFPEFLVASLAIRRGSWEPLIYSQFFSIASNNLGLQLTSIESRRESHGTEPLIWGGCVLGVCVCVGWVGGCWVGGCVLGGWVGGGGPVLTPGS